MRFIPKHWHPPPFHKCFINYAMEYMNVKIHFITDIGEGHFTHLLEAGDQQLVWHYEHAAQQVLFTAVWDDRGIVNRDKQNIEFIHQDRFVHLRHIHMPSQLLRGEKKVNKSYLNVELMRQFQKILNYRFPSWNMAIFSPWFIIIWILLI